MRRSIVAIAILISMAVFGSFAEAGSGNEVLLFTSREGSADIAPANQTCEPKCRQDTRAPGRVTHDRESYIMVSPCRAV